METKKWPLVVTIAREDGTVLDYITILVESNRDYHAALAVRKDIEKRYEEKR